MEIKLYNYKNEIVPVRYNSVKNIEYIAINVISGDEVMAIRYIDDVGNIKEDKFDSDIFKTRGMDMFDGGYVIMNDRLKEWLNFEPNFNSNKCISEQRLDKFGRREDDFKRE